MNTLFEPVLTPESYKQQVLEEHAKKPKKSLKLEDCTVDILDYLQRNGKASFKEITQNLNIPYRRASDVLNVLETLPIISREGKVEDHFLGKANTNPYVFCGGITLSSPVNLTTILEDIENEKLRILELEDTLKDDLAKAKETITTFKNVSMLN